MVLGFVVLIVVPIVVDSVVVVNVAVLGRIGAVVPLIVVMGLRARIWMASTRSEKFLEL